MRRAGVLLHISSLPSPYGIGAMGREAYQFVDFLQAAGQSFWQLLPVCPTGYGDSPYQSFSTFAGNPYFIDLPTLEREGLLTSDEYRDTDYACTPERINYGVLYEKRYPILRRAARRLLAGPTDAYQIFCRANSDWLTDYALFMALKGAHGGRAWHEWDEPFRHREAGPLSAFATAHREELAFWQVVQFLFSRQWQALKRYANGRGISIIGDLPIYVALDSADVWAHPSLFQLDEHLAPIEVAGCPPDGFCADGQLWGNPLFDWEQMEQDNFAWWRRRVAHQKSIYDVLRIDHFRGLAGYYAIPATDTTARRGRWRQGPGMKLLQALDCNGLIAEDLGFLDDGVRTLLHQSGLPGMKVLQFAFDSRESGDYLPHNYPTHCVVYTGTHDNDTALGWTKTAPAADVARATAYLNLTEKEGLNWGLMRGIWSSVGELAVVQMQDLLGLDSSARMNIPSTWGDNWKWRMLPGAASPALAEKVRRQMELYQRLPA